MRHTGPRPAGRTAGRKAPARTAAVCAAGVALVMGAAGVGHAAASTDVRGARQAAPQCGAAAAGGTGAATASVAAGSAAPAGQAATQPAATRQPLTFDLPRQAPVGLWTAAGLTLRAPVAKGTAHLDVNSTGFSTDSLEVQRYVPQTRQWVDLASAPST